MPGRQKIKTDLKKTMLKEVREDNQRLFEPGSALPRKAGPKPAGAPVPDGKRTHIGRTGLVFVALAGVVLFSVLSGMGKRSPASKPPMDEISGKIKKPASISATTAIPLKEKSATTADFSVPAAENNPILQPWPQVTINAGDYDRLLKNHHVRLSTLFGLGIHTVVIDPGHGGRDPGAVGALGTREKDITLDVARRLKQRLGRNEGLRIYLTRDTDQTVSLSDRVKYANAIGADLFIAIHVNALPRKDLNIIETYSFGPTADEVTLQLAQRENAASMYSSGDFRKLIQKIGDTMKQQESIALATAIQRSLFSNIRKYDKDVHNWGVKVAPFVVLLNVEAPAVLSEISCISNKIEEEKLKTTDYREKIASFIEKGVIGYLTQKGVQTQRGEAHAFKKNG